MSKHSVKRSLPLIERFRQTLPVPAGPQLSSQIEKHRGLYRSLVGKEIPDVPQQLDDLIPLFSVVCAARPALEALHRLIEYLSEGFRVGNECDSVASVLFAPDP